jgi:hypothetical protein
VLKNVFVRHGALILYSSCCRILGGEVKYFVPTSSLAQNDARVDPLVQHPPHLQVFQKHPSSSFPDDVVRVPTSLRTESNFDVFDKVPISARIHDKKDVDLLTQTTTAISFESTDFNSSFSLEPLLGKNVFHQIRFSCEGVGSSSAAIVNSAATSFSSSFPIIDDLSAANRLSLRTLSSSVVPLYPVDDNIDPLDAFVYETGDSVSRNDKVDNKNIQEKITPDIDIIASPIPCDRMCEVFGYSHPLDSSFLPCNVKDQIFTEDDDTIMTATVSGVQPFFVSKSEGLLEEASAVRVSVKAGKDDRRPEIICEEELEGEGGFTPEIDLSIIEVEEPSVFFQSPFVDLLVSQSDETSRNDQVNLKWRYLEDILQDGACGYSSSSFVRGLARRLYHFSIKRETDRSHHSADSLSFTMLIEFDDGRSSITAMVESDLCMNFFQQRCPFLLKSLEENVEWLFSEKSQGSCSQQQSVVRQMMLKLKYFHGVFSFRVLSDVEKQNFPLKEDPEIVLLKDVTCSSVYIQSLCKELLL